MRADDRRDNAEIPKRDRDNDDSELTRAIGDVRDSIRIALQESSRPLAIATAQTRRLLDSRLRCERSAYLSRSFHVRRDNDRIPRGLHL